MKPGLFLDRDGIVNQDFDYVHKVEDFKFIEDIFEICKIFQENHFLIFIITNQSGIARGYYSEEEHLKLTKWMEDEFLKNEIRITMYHCPHHPDYGIEIYRQDCDCRKPKPGMILRAKEQYEIDIIKSYLIGDRERDIESGIQAGILNNFLIHSPIKTKAAKRFSSHSELLSYLKKNSL